MGPIFIALTDVWPHTNWEMATNSLIAVIEVALSKALLNAYQVIYKVLLRF